MTEVRTSFAAEQSLQNQALLAAAGAVIATVVNDDRFRNCVLGRQFSDCMHEPDDGGKPSPRSPDQIADIVARGKERRTAPDDVIQLSIVLKQGMPSTVLGMVEPKDPTVFINHDFFDRCLARNDATALASVLLHEWMHVAGFIHPGTGMKHDVPYELGFIVLELAPVPATFYPKATWIRFPADMVVAMDWEPCNWDCHFPEQPHRERRREKPARAAHQRAPTGTTVR